MSGVERPAAIVGVVGVGFQCLASCIRELQLFSTVFQVGKKTEHYRCAIILEEEWLLSWEKWSGLIDSQLDRRMNEVVVNQALSSLSELLISTEKLADRYELDIVVSDLPHTPGPQYSSPFGEDLSFLESEALVIERAKLLQAAKKIQKHVPFKLF